MEAATRAVSSHFDNRCETQNLRRLFSRGAPPESGADLDPTVIGNFVRNRSDRPGNLRRRGGLNGCFAGGRRLRNVDSGSLRGIRNGRHRRAPSGVHECVTITPGSCKQKNRDFVNISLSDHGTDINTKLKVRLKLLLHNVNSDIRVKLKFFAHHIFRSIHVSRIRPRYRALCSAYDTEPHNNRVRLEALRQLEGRHPARRPVLQCGKCPVRGTPRVTASPSG